MEDKFQNKYRISSPRLNNWDYGSDGLYFITICTKDRRRYFGEIESVDVAQLPAANQPEMRSIASLQMTSVGKIARDNFEKIPLYHPYVELEDFVIMPDHVHGIININKPDKITWEVNKFGSQKNNLGSIVRGFKSSVTTFATINNIGFLWQPRYYDRVIRNEKEYLNIKGYIKENPDQWYRNGDDFNNLFKP